MALTVTARGVGAGSIASGSFTFSPSSTFGGGKAVLLVSYDNSGSSGADPYTALPTASGGTFEALVDQLRDPGAASAGAVHRIFMTDAGVSWTTSTVVTWCASNNNGSNGDKVAWVLWEVAGAPNVGFVTGSGVQSSGTAFTMTTGTITAGDALICGLALEDSSSGADDIDVTNGLWSTGQAANTTGGGGAANIGIRSQYKVQAVLDSTQTWNFTVANADWAAAWVQLRQRAFGSFTANAVIRKTVNVSVSADAVIVRTVSDGFTANAIVKKTLPVPVISTDTYGVISWTGGSQGWDAVELIGVTADQDPAHGIADDDTLVLHIDLDTGFIPAGYVLSEARLKFDTQADFDGSSLEISAAYPSSASVYFFSNAMETHADHSLVFSPTPTRDEVNSTQLDVDVVLDLGAGFVYIDYMRAEFDSHPPITIAADAVITAGGGPATTFVVWITEG